MPPTSLHWLDRHIEQGAGGFGIEVDEGQADGGGDLVAVVVRQVIDAQGDAAPIANEPAGTVDAEGGAFGVVGRRGADAPVGAIGQRHLGGDDHRRTISNADLPGHGRRQRARLIHRQEFAQAEQLGIAAAIDERHSEDMLSC